jgi:hypothetical protein
MRKTTTRSITSPDGITNRTLTADQKSEHNPRKISTSRLAMLKDSLDQFGDLGGIILNRRTNKLVGGHQRLTAWENRANVTITETLKKPDRVGTVAYGFVQIDGTRYAYREVDWDENRERAANLAANKHGGEFDDAKLMEIVRNLDTAKPESSAIGFDPKELAVLLAAATPTEPTKPEVVFEQAVQLKPQMEYVLVACDTKDQFDALREKLKLKTVRRGGYKPGSEFDDIGVDRVIKYDRFVKLLR